MQRYVVEEGEEDLAEVAVCNRVPDFAPGTGGRAEPHLASRPPHRRRAWSARSFHRMLSMERGWGRIETSDAPGCRGGGRGAESTPLLRGSGVIISREASTHS